MSDGLFLNYNYSEYSEKKINSLLKKLKKHELPKMKNKQCEASAQVEIDEIARYLSEIHKRNIGENCLEKYNVDWAIKLIENADNFQYKSDIIAALRLMKNIEHAQPSLSMENKFLSWETESGKWAYNYNSGHVGRCIWDIAAVLHYMSDPIFSDQFLKSYIFYSNEKLPLSVLYANIFYIQVIESVLCKDESAIRRIALKIISESYFESEIISYDTLVKLRLLGYS